MIIKCNCSDPNNNWFNNYISNHYYCSNYPGLAALNIVWNGAQRGDEFYNEVCQDYDDPEFWMMCMDPNTGLVNAACFAIR